MNFRRYNRIFWNGIFPEISFSRRSGITPYVHGKGRRSEEATEADIHDGI